jgi:uncharacterized membrane protein
MERSSRKKTLLPTGAAFGAAVLMTLSSSAAFASDGEIGSGEKQLVECYGVGNVADAPVMMTKSMCDKLPATKQVPVNTKDYVHCYGVAAAGKNDCATKTASCSGSAKVAKAADAWVALPAGVCENLKDSSLTSK